MTRRYYSSIAAPTTLTAGINSSTTSVPVTAVTGFPSSYPYTIILDKDTASEEIITVTSRSGLTLTATRGVGGTTGVAHSSGASVTHGVYDADFEDAAAHVAASAAVHGLAGTVVGTSDTQTLTNKTISGASNTLSAVAQSSVTNLTTDLAAKAPLASPTLTGTPAAPTAAVGTSTTQIATTAYVQGELPGRNIVPSSVSATSGTVSVNAAGLVTATGASNVKMLGVASSASKHIMFEVRLKGSTQTVVRLRLGSGGSDDSSAHYNQQTIVTNGATDSPGESNLITSIAVGLVDTAANGFATVDVVCANQAEFTTVRTEAQAPLAAGGTYVYRVWGYFDQTTSFTDVNFIPDSGTLTGEIRAYTKAI